MGRNHLVASFLLHQYPCAHHSFVKQVKLITVNILSRICVLGKGKPRVFHLCWWHGNGNRWVICIKASVWSFSSPVGGAIYFSPSIPFVHCLDLQETLNAKGGKRQHQNMLVNDICHFSRSAIAQIAAQVLEENTGNLL